SLCDFSFHLHASEYWTSYRPCLYEHDVNCVSMRASAPPECARRGEGCNRLMKVTRTLRLPLSATRYGEQSTQSLTTGDRSVRSAPGLRSLVSVAVLGAVASPASQGGDLTMIGGEEITRRLLPSTQPRTPGLRANRQTHATGFQDTGADRPCC